MERLDSLFGEDWAGTELLDICFCTQSNNGSHIQARTCGMYHMRPVGVSENALQHSLSWGNILKILYGVNEREFQHFGSQRI